MKLFRRSRNTLTNKNVSILLKIPLFKVSHRAKVNKKDPVIGNVNLFRIWKLALVRIR